MNENERRTLVQIKILAEEWMGCECRGGCVDCIGRVARIFEQVTDLLSGKADGTDADRR